MKKIVRVDYRANDELKRFSPEVQFKFKGCFRTLEADGRLEFPESKKIDKNLFEIRINFEGAYRGFYAYIKGTYVIILHAFKKTSQKTPLKNLKISRKRMKEYE